jgi:hypothetical protein
MPVPAMFAMFVRTRLGIVSSERDQYADAY